MTLLYLLYVSIILEEIQNIFSTVLWLSLVLWCIVALIRDSNKAVLWAKVLFGIHLFFAVFSILFPPDFGSNHYIFIMGLLCAALTSLVGLIVSFFAKERPRK